MMKEYQEPYGVVITQGWGMTETSPLAALATPPPEVTGEEPGHCAPSAGRVLCGVEIRIVDDAAAVLPNDGKAVGEIEIRGPWITGSYYRNADSVEVRRRLAAAPVTSADRPTGLHHADRSRQGCHQVGR